MEKERAFAGNWPSTDGILPPEMCAGAGAGAEQLPHSFLNVVWEQPTPHAQAHFESALSSLISSPSSNAPAGNDSVVIRELIGRLGSICNSGDISPPSGYHSARTSCYSTPLNSPPKLNLSGADHHQQGRGGLPKLGNQVAAAQFGPFAADPAFAERAARFSCFGPRTQGGLGAQLRLPEAGTLSRVSNSQSLMATTGREVSIASPDRMEAERSKFGGRTPGTSSPEASSASDRLTAGGGGGNGRKRKAASKGKSKGVPLSSSTSNPAQEDNSDIKRCKPAETNGPDNNEAARPNTEPIRDGGQKQGEENNAKAALEPPKDYIHVRARRGQATDSHSLAERVRREKISERMKLLQDLVPGCNKITGKAVMLDEIINYVQSLQRQVEFLSMKLATLNPQLEFDMENLLPKDMHQTQTHGPLPPQFYPLDMATSAFPYAQHPQGAAPLQTTVANGLTAQGSLNPVDSFLRRTSSLQLAPLDGFADPASQLGNMYEDDLQYFVQMGSGQSQGTAFATQTSLHHE